MKKVFSTLLILLLLITGLRAQDVLKEARFTLHIDVPEGTPNAAAIKASMGGEQIMYIKNGSIRVEMKNPMGNLVLIYNRERDERYRLTDMMGNKQAIVSSHADIEAANKENAKKYPSIQYTEDTKTIAGYPCHRVIFTYHIDDKEQKYDCWVTDQIDAGDNNFSMGKIPGLKGFGMDITLQDKDFGFIITVSKVEKMVVPDSLFELPPDYPVKEKNTNSYDTPKYPIGTKLPDITLNDVNGQPIKLSSLKGKYVLVDFWASWCGPCRGENPNVVKAYNKYKSKGFMVYSISLDEDKTKWQKAIEKDNLAWPAHVCDYLGWKSPICTQFGVVGIPCNYLIDKDGTIIGYNLRDDKLEEKLKEVMK